jgi:hypothetical protein
MIAIDLPDKWVRKMVYDAIIALSPDTPVYDSRTNADYPANYVLFSTQNNISDPTSKCGYRWNHTLQIDVYGRIAASGNPGSRVAADDLVQVVLNAISDLSFDPASGLHLVRYNVNTPFDSVIDDGSYMVTQKVIQLNCIIN